MESRGRDLSCSWMLTRKYIFDCFCLATVMERRSAVSEFCCTIRDLSDEGENGLLLSASPPITDLSFTPTLLPV